MWKFIVEIHCNLPATHSHKRCVHEGTNGLALLCGGRLTRPGQHPLLLGGQHSFAQLVLLEQCSSLRPAVWLCSQTCWVPLWLLNPELVQDALLLQLAAEVFKLLL
jgi:hypothetical protein